MRIALDATYSLGRNLSGVGVYSRKILCGLPELQPRCEFLFCYRPHGFLKSFEAALPPNCRRSLLFEPVVPRSAALFHGLNQRLPHATLRRAVSTFHDLFVISGDYSTPEFRRRFEDQARHAAAHSDLIICVSEFTARQVENLLGIHRSRLRVVHHGTLFPPGEPLHAAARARIVFHAGAIQKRKNIRRLVEAFECIDTSWRLALAGSFGYGAAGILHRIEQSPARGRIDVLGYLPDAELARWYSRAAIFAFPSLDEGFGMPVLEAMAHGLPVLTSDRSALPEVAGDAALLVNPEDTHAIAASLKTLAESEELREKLGNRGRRRAAGFTWQAAVSETFSVYSELLP